MESCLTCKFFLPVRDAEGNPTADGFCRRYPPQVISDVDQHSRYTEGYSTQAWSRLPEVAPTEWCGEYAKKDE